MSVEVIIIIIRDISLLGYVQERYSKYGNVSPKSVLLENYLITHQLEYHVSLVEYSLSI